MNAESVENLLSFLMSCRRTGSTTANLKAAEDEGAWLLKWQAHFPNSTSKNILPVNRSHVFRGIQPKRLFVDPEVLSALLVNLRDLIKERDQLKFQLGLERFEESEFQRKIQSVQKMLITSETLRGFDVECSSSEKKLNPYEKACKIAQEFCATSPGYGNHSYDISFDEDGATIEYAHWELQVPYDMVTHKIPWEELL